MTGSEVVGFLGETERDKRESHKNEERKMLRWSARLIKTAESQHLEFDMRQIDRIMKNKVPLCSASIVSFFFVILQVYPPYLSPSYIYLYRDSVSLMGLPCLSTAENLFKGEVTALHVSWFVLKIPFYFVYNKNQLLWRYSNCLSFLFLRG